MGYFSSLHKEREHYWYILSLCLSFLFIPLGLSARHENAFSLNSSQKVQTITIRYFLDRNTSLKPFRERTEIYGLDMDMEITRLKRDFLVRVVLEDINGKEYLVAESYKEIADTEKTLSLREYCEETALLYRVIPKSLNIFVRNATLQIHSLRIVTDIPDNLKDQKRLQAVTDEIHFAQVHDKVAKINGYNYREGYLWLADITKLGIKDYSTRKNILGFPDSISTGGLEYYKEGIFELPYQDENMEENERKRSSEIRRNAAYTDGSSFTKKFTWRNRHNKNWMTPDKDQGNSGYCAAFTAVACTEAMLNLYLNQKVDLSLSEQQAACCNGTYNPWKGMSPTAPLRYIKNHGVFDEASYPFVNDSLEGLHCRSEEVNPHEMVWISDFKQISSTAIDSVKKALIHDGPLSSGFWWKESHIGGGHSMVLVGYFDIQEGDSLHALRHYTGGCDDCYGMDSLLVVKDTIKHMGNVIGKTCWVFKNSYASEPYFNLILQNQNNMIRPYKLIPPIIWKSISYNGTETLHNDVVCEDADNDGYYYWGIGPKPANCPPGVPDIPDGDDSNPELGPMDEYGNLEILRADDRDTIFISSNQVTTFSRNYVNHIVVCNHATWTIRDSLYFYGDASITVKSGSTVIIDDHALLENVRLNLEPGANLEVSNNAIIHFRKEYDFNVPTGATFKLNCGMLERSQQ